MIELPRVKRFAIRAHGQQVRKYTRVPYWTHPEAVAGLIQSLDSHTSEQIAIAWLHDTIEDTEITYDQIASEFGIEIADGVLDLTARKTDGNRAIRKERERIRLSKIPPQIKTIKVADILDNCTTIVSYDPEFAKVYLKEKFAVLNVLKEADQALWIPAMSLIRTQIFLLGSKD